MAIQDEFGRIGFFEDFIGAPAASTITDATAGTLFKDVTLVAISGDVAMTHTVDESGGVVAFSGAGGAADGIALLGTPMQPSTNGTIVAGGRFKVSAATDYRAFVGLQETISLSETVNPYTLSGTTLTSNAAGNVVGFYYDTQATTDDFRFMAGTNSAAATSGRIAIPGNINSTLGSLGVRCNVTLTADTWMVWKLELHPDGSCDAWFGDETMANKNGLTWIGKLAPGVISATALYVAHMHLAEQSTGDPTHEVDYFYQKGNRDWAA